MNIITLIVLYNPSNDYLDHYLPLLDFSSKVIFLDNSTKVNQDLVDKIKRIPTAEYISLNGNQGIAKALKVGVEKAIEEQADLALTLDQDSIFPASRMNDILDILEKNKDNNYGIIGLNFNSDETSLEIEDVKWWLTSGNFIYLKNYQKLKQGFDEKLFIDGVDNAIGYQFHQIGCKVGYIKGISLKHTIGNPKVKHIGKLKFSILNYNPIRYYYIYRNINYLYSLDQEFFKEDKHNIDRIMYYKILLFEKHKRKKLKAIKYGRRDAKNKVLGPCKHDDIL